jgi:hypothetical protein
MNVAYKPSITMNSNTLTDFQQKHALEITIFPFAGVITALVMAKVSYRVN